MVMDTMSNRGNEIALPILSERDKTDFMKISTSIIAVPLLALFCGQSAHCAPQLPGPEQRQTVALVGGTIHPITSPPIEDGVLIFSSGRITSIGKKVKVPTDAKRINLKGKHVYPGLFDAHTNIGLVEINAVRATRDFQETGRINPNVKVEVAVNPDSEIIPVTRSNGILLAVSAPGGGLISGRSAVMQLDGWTYEEMTLHANASLYINWPNMTPVVDFHEERSAEQQSKDRDEALSKLSEFFADARAYQKARNFDGNQQPFDTRLDAMIPVLAGDIPVVVRADEIQQIQSAVTFAVRENVKLIIHGGYDAPHCDRLLKKHDIPVIVSAVYRLPRHRGDDYDAAYTLPERLRKAGVKFCISGSGRFGASNARNLPYHAATAAAYGLPEDEALKSITIYPAQILGVADRVGSIEVGKDATLFISDGNPLETTTHVKAAFIQGRTVDLSNRHKMLWKKYREKYRRLEGKSAE